jgi:hypothetical protein
LLAGLGFLIFAFLHPAHVLPDGTLVEPFVETVLGFMLLSLAIGAGVLMRLGKR